MKISSKPFVKMTTKELNDTFDEMAAPGDQGLLEEARTTNQDIELAIAVLTMTDGSTRAVYWTCEYGDNDGNEHIENFIRRVQRRRGMLAIGESLHRQNIMLFANSLYMKTAYIRNSQ